MSVWYLSLMSLWYIHAMIASLMLQKMVLSAEPILPLAGTAVHIAVNVSDIIMSRRDVTVDIGFARESRTAARPFARYSFRVISVISVSCDETRSKAMNRLAPTFPYLSYY
jgi:hypothetical protein